MGKKSRSKQEFRKKYPGGWKEYYLSQKPSTWSFSDGLSGFTFPEGVSFVEGFFLFLLVIVITTMLDLSRILFRFPKKTAS